MITIDELKEAIKKGFIEGNTVRKRLILRVFFLWFYTC